MPRYDYRCRDCGFEEEYIHSFKETPLFPCPDCATHMVKFFTRVNFSTKHSALGRRVRDDHERESDMRQELLEEHLVEKISPIGAKDIAQVYNEVKASGSSVKDQMQKTIEVNNKKMKVKQKDWQIGANRRVKKKTIEARTRRAEEDQAKRKITVTTKKS